MSQPLISFTQESAARLLISHLKAHGIAAQYHQVDQQHQVSIVADDKLERAVELTQAFVSNPNAAQYQQDAWQMGEQSAQSAGLGFDGKSLQTLWQSPMATLVSVVCLMVFAASVLGYFGAIQQWLFIQPFDVLIQSQQWWRLLTPDVVHFSAIHLIFNLMWWQMLGSQIERRLGLTTLMMLFISASVISNVGQLWVSGPNFGGMSGVVYALVGFVWWLGWLRPAWGINLPKPIIGFLLVWLLIGYADVLWISMANTAHTLGLITGCVLALLITRWPITKANRA